MTRILRPRSGRGNFGGAIAPQHEPIRRHDRGMEIHSHQTDVEPLSEGRAVGEVGRDVETRGLGVEECDVGVAGGCGCCCHQVSVSGYPVSCCFYWAEAYSEGNGKGKGGIGGVEEEYESRPGSGKKGGRTNRDTAPVRCCWCSIDLSRRRRGDPVGTRAGLRGSGR